MTAAPPSPPGDRRLRLARRCLATIGWIVPAWRRDDWLREWEAEVWHHQAGRGGVGDLLARLAGALPHALRLRQGAWRLDLIGRDLRQAWRVTRQRPGFALLVVGTLALGIGANTAMFSVVNAVLIRPLPYPEPDRLVFGYGTFAKSPRAAMSPPDYLDYRERNRVFSGFAARTIGDEVVLTGDGEPERLRASRVSANFFATLGIVPLHGRFFLPEEERGEGAPVTVLSHGLWLRRFGGDPAVVGRTATLDGRATEIVGVLPRLLDQSLDFEVWQPIRFGTPGTSIRRYHFLRGVARLAPGVTLAQAQAEIDRIAAELAATYPENESWSLRLVPYREVVVGELGRALVVLLGAVGLVLLIACGNVANLLLARASARRGEIVIRTALGASRGRLVRQLLTESLFLALLGGLAGLGLASLLVELLRTIAAGVLPRLATVEIDGAVLLFTVASSLATGLVFGVVPALHTATPNPTATLVALGRGSARTGRGRDGLVAAQVALSVVLLVAAGLLLRSLSSLTRVESGFDPGGVLTANLSLPSARYASAADQRRFWSAMAERLAVLPGVETAAVAGTLPFLGGGDVNYWVEGQVPTSESERRNAMVVAVSEDYFRTLRIPVIAGRGFGPAERAGGPAAIVVSRGLAARLFPGASPLGRRLVLDFTPNVTAEIVGVAGDVRAFGPTGPVPDAVYFSPHQIRGFGLGYLNLVVRTGGDPALLAEPVRRAVVAEDPDLALADVRTMEAIVGMATSAQRFSARLLSGFAAAAAILAVIGLYGILAYAVAQRAVEIGIRLALGAAPREVFGMVVWRGLRVIGAGLGIGLAAAVVASRAIQGQLFDVSPTDPAVYGAVALVLGLAGLAASIGPARRATRIDPVTALRADG